MDLIKLICPILILFIFKFFIFIIVWNLIDLN